MRLSKGLHQALRSGSTSMSKRVGEALFKATIDDIVDALKQRYYAADPPEPNDVTTKVIVSEAAFNNIELFSIKLGIPRDTLVKIVVEHFVLSANKRTETTKNPN